MMSFISYSSSNAQDVTQNNSQQITLENPNSLLLYPDYCCWQSINSITLTNSVACCVDLTMIDKCSEYSEIVDRRYVSKFEIFNSVTGQYELVAAEIGGNEKLITVRLCAINGESYVKYRVRLYYPDGVTPHKCGSQIEDFVEGDNQITGEVAVNCCPCPPLFNNYLTAEVIPDACPDHACKVVLKLDLPDSLANCFKYFVYESTYPGGMSAPMELWDGRINNTISEFDFCLPQGKTATITLYLLKYKEEPLANACKIIRKIATCYNIPQPSKVLCKPDCDKDEWSSERTNVFSTTNCPGCKARVSYVHRFACNKSYQDLQITKIEFLTKECSNCDIDMLYKDFLGSVIALNRMGFEPQKDSVGCNTTWRIANGGCWANWSYYVYDNGKITDTITVYEPCDSVECCLQPMTVCRDKDNRITIKIDSANGSSGKCSGKWTTSPTTGDKLPCNPACDWLAGLNGSFPYQEPNGKINKKEVYEDINYLNSFGIRTEIGSQKVTVYIKSTKQSTVKLSIFDMQGSELLSNSANINSGVNQISISTSNISSGIYIYVIEIDGMRIRTEKLSVVK